MLQTALLACLLVSTSQDKLNKDLSDKVVPSFQILVGDDIEELPCKVGVVFVLDRGVPTPTLESLMEVLTEKPLTFMGNEFVVTNVTWAVEDKMVFVHHSGPSCWDSLSEFHFVIGTAANEHFVKKYKAVIVKREVHDDKAKNVEYLKKVKAKLNRP